jgi:hypothetical protein
MYGEIEAQGNQPLNPSMYCIRVNSGLANQICSARAVTSITPWGSRCRSISSMRAGGPFLEGLFEPRVLPPLTLFLFSLQQLIFIHNG